GRVRYSHVRFLQSRGRCVWRPSAELSRNWKIDPVTSSLRISPRIADRDVTPLIVSLGVRITGNNDRADLVRWPLPCALGILAKLLGRRQGDIPTNRVWRVGGGIASSPSAVVVIMLYNAVGISCVPGASSPEWNIASAGLPTT